MNNINKNKNVSSGGLGIVGVAQIVFIILKLCKLIDWEWWIVLAPLWGSAALIVGGFNSYDGDGVVVDKLGNELCGVWEGKTIPEEAAYVIWFNK